ncbi:hypothetical protein RFI_14082 [Reticulomyxa filosa]|uniref:Uncharacterized protein n=1 Tax=Reticulomyxa filosa TaxID=46433 RepID=X6NCQ2_RETFI|nr:hypothetical protein RFI_14082 [Reticulomyxa filosa]|eukprot:ETO23102.1 hypothetical protein RFI_14082 [Reticulomyxa filosa]
MLTSYWVLIRIQPLMNIESVESLIKVKRFHKDQELKHEEEIIEMSAVPASEGKHNAADASISMEMANGNGHIGDIPLSPHLESHGSNHSNHSNSEVHNHNDDHSHGFANDSNKSSIKIPLLSKLEKVVSLPSSKKTTDHLIKVSKQDISLKMVLKHVKAFEAFMAYLAKGIFFVVIVVVVFIFIFCMLIKKRIFNGSRIVALRVCAI